MPDTTNQAAPGDLFFQALVDAYVASPRFLRRDWLATEIEDRLADPACRFVLVTAPPGAGQTALMAQLAHDHPDWLRYFIRRDERTPLGDVDARSFLLRLGYQLAALRPELFAQERVRLAIEQRIGVVESSGEVVGAEIQRIVASPFYRRVIEIRQAVTRNAGQVTGLRIGELAVEPHLLDSDQLASMALFDPVRASAADAGARGIVILVDALDEIRYQADDAGNKQGRDLLEWLTSCPELPPNVRFVLTSRPPDVALQNFCNKQTPSLRSLALSAEDPRVLEDMRAYVRRFAGRSEVAAALAAAGQNPAEFAAAAVAAAHGNLGYLDALERGVDRALARGEARTLADLLALRDLPDDLESLYAFFLLQLRAEVDRERVEEVDPETGETYDKKAWPALYTPLLGALAVALAPLSLDQIQRLGNIKAAREYVVAAADRLRQFLDEAANRYRLYHATVAEFLTSPVTRDASPPTSDLYLEPLRWHKQIAGRLWQGCSGDWSCCDDYAPAGLAVHLRRAGRTAELFALINPAARLAWRTRTRSDYAFDQALGEAIGAALDLPPAERLPQLARCGLIAATLRSQLSAVPAEVLRELARQGQWQRALVLAQLAGSEMGAGLAAIVAGLLDAEALDAACQVAAQIPEGDAYHRARGLAQVAARLAAQGAVSPDQAAARGSDQQEAGQWFDRAHRAADAIPADEINLDARGRGLAFVARQWRPWDSARAAALFDLALAAVRSMPAALAGIALENVAFFNPASQTAAQAVALAQRTPFDTIGAKARAMADVAAEMAAAGDPAAATIFAEAEALVRAITVAGPAERPGFEGVEETFRDHALDYIAARRMPAPTPALPAALTADELERRVAMAQRLPRDTTGALARALTHLAAALLSAGGAETSSNVPRLLAQAQTAARSADGGFQTLLHVEIARLWRAAGDESAATALERDALEATHGEVSFAGQYRAWLEEQGRQAVLEQRRVAGFRAAIRKGIEHSDRAKALMVESLAEKNLAAAEELANDIRGAVAAARAHAAIAGRLAKTDPDRANELVGQIIEEALASPATEQDEILDTAAEALGPLDVQLAHRVATAFEDPARQTEILVRIARTQPVQDPATASYWEVAWWQAADKASGGGADLAQALADLGGWFADRDAARSAAAFRAAIAAARVEPFLSKRVEALCRIANLLAPRDAEQGRQLLAEAEAVARAEPAARALGSSLARIAATWIESDADRGCRLLAELRHLGREAFLAGLALAVPGLLHRFGRELAQPIVDALAQADAFFAA